MLAPGELIVSISAGGGGYGNPLERDAQRVCHDVAEGWISAARAQAVYGVVFDRDCVVDAVATQRLRAEMTQAPGPGA